MRYPTLLLLITAVLLLPLTAHAASEEDGVREAIGHYFQGHATNDAAHMRKVFLPTGHIEGIRNGKFVSWTVDEYLARFNSKPAADEAKRTRTIDSIDVTGDAAMAKATLVHGNTTFVDYFVLVKALGSWKIANKVYNARTAGGEAAGAGEKPVSANDQPAKVEQPSPSPEG